MHENVVHLHLIHFCDEQTQVAVRESALIVTSRECHKGVNSPLLNLQSQSEGHGRQSSLHSTQHALYALSTLILTVVSIVDFHAMNIRNPTSSLSQIEFTLPGIHKTSELFNYRNLFLRESISFVTQLHEDSCQRLFFPRFCPPIPKFALTLIKE